MPNKRVFIARATSRAIEKKTFDASFYRSAMCLVGRDGPDRKNRACGGFDAARRRVDRRVGIKMIVHRAESRKKIVAVNLNFPIA